LVWDATQIKIENENDYFNEILTQIDHKRKNRAVLVFFDSDKSLKDFQDSSALQSIQDDVQIMTEENDSLEKERLIKSATCSGQVTLLTKAFGRGTDFVCTDHTVTGNGGLHVIQTFLSEERSEEKQIKGRTARQGDDGSYSMILLDKSLETFLIQPTDVSEIAKRYEVLNEKRNAFFKQQYKGRELGIEQAKKEHSEALAFIECISSPSGDMDIAKIFYKPGTKEHKLKDPFQKQFV